MCNIYSLLLLSVYVNVVPFFRSFDAAAGMCDSFNGVLAAALCVIGRQLCFEDDGFACFEGNEVEELVYSRTSGVCE